MTGNFTQALLLSTLAGLATAVGGALAFCIKKKNLALLAVGLGFSAGVMVYVSFMELLPQAMALLREQVGFLAGEWIATSVFFGGILVAFLIDFYLPSHHLQRNTLKPSTRLERVGLFTALVLAVHNFPEGLTTFMAAFEDRTLGISIALAVAIHNIPEGIAVALPVFHATGKRTRAFWLSMLAGLAEPVGALTGFFMLRAWLHGATPGVLFALVAGMMVYISLDELLPTAHEYGEGHHVIGGVVAGMFVMALSLLLI